MKRLVLHSIGKNRKQPHGPGVQGSVHFAFLLKMVPIKVAIAISIAIGFVFSLFIFLGACTPPEKQTKRKTKPQAMATLIGTLPNLCTMEFYNEHIIGSDINFANWFAVGIFIFRKDL